MRTTKTKKTKKRMKTIGRTTKKIPLTQGQFATVDLEDFEWLNQWNWYAAWQPRMQSYYVVRKSKQDPITHKQKLIQMHRVIMKLKHGDKRQIDHENHNTLDNCKSNLQIVTNRENSENRHDQSRYGAGVKRRTDCDRYESQVRMNGKKHYLGLFKTQEEAQAARKQFLKEN